MSKADSIKARLLNIAVKSGKNNEYIQTHYFIERLLYRLSVSRLANDFVLKGGLLLHAIFDNRARATRDIDLMPVRSATCRIKWSLCSVRSALSRLMMAWPLMKSQFRLN
jgi:predicted nucleotidyltransferase component of viral defense system